LPKQNKELLLIRGGHDMSFRMVVRGCHQRFAVTAYFPTRFEVGQAFVELAANRLIHVKNRTEDAVDVGVWPGWSSLHQWNIFAESMLAALGGSC
jgi:hypothetical protein